MDKHSEHENNTLQVISKMSTPSHRARRKKKPDIPFQRTATTQDVIAVDQQGKSTGPGFPLVAFLWPARSSTSQWITLPLILIIAGLFRWAVGLWGYSGYQKPPMHGDFEAQRHWMEITTHLPMSMWYFYDLPYWGLDYPPLTAYHSWICGKIGTLIDPTWFALDKSRGMESQLLKVYMRATVIVSEYLIYVPAVIIFLRHYGRNQGVGKTSGLVALVAMLMQPATILIDHGHFQYNTVMLGLFVASISSIFADRLLWACIFFVAALGFKQMALYYAPIMFAYLLGRCLTPKVRIGRLITIGIATMVAFAALLAPLLVGIANDIRRKVPQTSDRHPSFLSNLGVKFDPSTTTGMLLLHISQVIHRCFPFARGLFEDKVANFWCFTNTFFKLRKLEGIVELPTLSLFLTIMSILAPMMVIGAVPRKSLLPYALASSAWGFFLFSFQVHEKSVLLPLLPMTLLLGSKNGLSKEYRAWIGYANILGVWTMYPLLQRDELKTAYVIVPLVWLFLLGLPPTSVSAYYDHATRNEPGKDRHPDDMYAATKILHFQSYVVMAFWHLLAAYAEPPADKPDLWVVVNVCFGFGGFTICYLWCTWKLILGSGLLDEYLNYRRSEDAIVVEGKKTQ